MIIKTQAIPLAHFPYSSTSRVVHWLTRDHGKVSTLLKGALRPRSPFLGEYELFSTSELLFFSNNAQSLFTAKECALLHRRAAFRRDWRAMQSASYLAHLISKTTPEGAPQPDLFAGLEEWLDLAETFGRHPHFLFWVELDFCRRQGHSPQLQHCIRCGTDRHLRFCAEQGGTVCRDCTAEHTLPFLECPPDLLAALRSWQQADHPAPAVKTRLTEKKLQQLNALLGTFMLYQFNLNPEPRNAIRPAA